MIEQHRELPSRSRIAAILLLACLAAAGIPGPTAAGEAPRLLEEPPGYGVYYERYEPTFYTGFAPRTGDPRRLHVHIGRGNQLRATTVLSDDVVEQYAGDLLERGRTYRALVAGGKVVPTQNRALEAFEKKLAEVGVARLVREEAGLDAGEQRERNLRLIEQLNPGRVFRIRMKVDEVLERWLAALRPEDRKSMEEKRRLELVNLLLPTRLHVADLDPATSSALTQLVQHSAAEDDLDGLRSGYLALLDRASGGIYPVRDGEFHFAEFTAIYPIGTWNQSTTVNGRQIPEYPTPGRRALTVHQRTRTIDHIPDEQSYSYHPWIPYMHVGTRMHNALHTLFWRMKISETSFLPAAWREARGGDGEPYEYLWLLSRGPMSHGCTHVNAGHISELRQILPATPEQMAKVDVFYNKTPHYDVFDIDGDLTPEVMGVRYFIAFSLTTNDKPERLRVRNERVAYYEWLYGGDLGYDRDGRGVFAGVTDGRFFGRAAAAGAAYRDIRLFEADYEPEKIQFYRHVDIPFARELRKVGAEGHAFENVEAGAR
ncbi:MAG: hypothetical protein ABR538_12340 [Candidatus Binatia bacterium]